MKLTKKIMAVSAAVLLAALALIAVAALAQPAAATPVMADSAIESVAVLDEASDVQPEEEQPAEEPAEEGSSMTAIGAAVAIGLAAIGGAIAMGMAISKAMEGIARQPEAGSAIRTTMIIIAALLEGAAMFGLVICLLTMIMK